jgi:hypothetical protein
VAGGAPVCPLTRARPKLRTPRKHARYHLSQRDSVNRAQPPRAPNALCETASIAKSPKQFKTASSFAPLLDADALVLASLHWLSLNKKKTTLSTLEAGPDVASPSQLTTEAVAAIVPEAVGLSLVKPLKLIQNYH